MKETKRDGTEETSEVSIAVSHFVPKKGHGRIYMRSDANADWSDGELKGSIFMPLGSAAVLVSIRRKEEGGDEHVFTFEPKDLVEAALALYRKRVCRTCGAAAEVVDAAPPGESGDVMRCSRCDAAKGSS